MRKNTRAVHRAFMQRERSPACAAIWTDGDTIFSYGTAVVIRHPDGGYVVNTTSYSRTTTIHVNGLLSVLPRDLVRMADGLPMGAKPEGLLRAAGPLPLDRATITLDWAIGPGDDGWQS